MGKSKSRKNKNKKHSQKQDIRQEKFQKEDGALASPTTMLSTMSPLPVDRSKQSVSQAMVKKVTLIDVKETNNTRNTNQDTSASRQINDSKNTKETKETKERIRENEYFWTSTSEDIVSKTPYMASQTNPFACYEDHSTPNLAIEDEALNNSLNDSLTIFYDGFQSSDKLPSVVQWIEQHVDASIRPYHSFFMLTSQNRREKPLCLKFHTQEQMLSFTQLIGDVIMDRHVTQMTYKQFLKKSINNQRRMAFREQHSRSDARPRGNARSGTPVGGGFDSRRNFNQRDQGRSGQPFAPGAGKGFFSRLNGSRRDESREDIEDRIDQQFRRFGVNKNMEDRSRRSGDFEGAGRGGKKKQQNKRPPIQDKRLLPQAPGHRDNAPMKRKREHEGNQQRKRGRY